LIADPESISVTLAPEIWACYLGIPLAAAGTLWWWLGLPDRDSTWITMAPALTAALLPLLVSVFDDAAGRWWFSAAPGTDYQARVVALLGVGVAFAVVGARERLAGPLFAGLLALTSVVLIQLIELGRFLPQWVSFAVAGLLLVAAGARWEWVRGIGIRGSRWVGALR
jgi:hypothetical protein